jgi:hypothetical protein
MPTTGASLSLNGTRPAKDAFTVARFGSAGGAREPNSARAGAYPLPAPIVVPEFVLFCAAQKSRVVGRQNPALRADQRAGKTDRLEIGIGGRLMPTRRDVLKVALLSALEPTRAFFQMAATSVVTEQQKGDPDLPYEHVSFNPEGIRKVASHAGKASFEKWDAHLPASMITTARAFLGSSRTSTPGQITEFLALSYLRSFPGAVSLQENLLDQFAQRSLITF